MQLALYCVLIFGASFAGGTLPSLMRLGHTRMQLAMSLIGGLMLGVALLHLLPHSVVATGSTDVSAAAVLGGLLAMFFLIRIFHVHPHAPQDDAHGTCSHGVPHAHGLEPPGETLVALQLAHDHGHAPQEHAETAAAGSQFGWCGLAVGLSLHTMIDGVALAASVAVEHEHASWWPALGPFCAVLLHKPLDALSIATVMKAAGWSRVWTTFVNMLFSLMCPLGAFLFWIGLTQLANGQQLVLGTALGFSAGVFLCIALSDLLPEVQFHTHDRWKLSTALVSGIVLAYLISFLEPAHLHGGPQETPGARHGHQHDSHDHDHDHGHQSHGADPSTTDTSHGAH